MKTFKNFFGLYFSVPKNHAQHANNVAKISTYGAHVLLFVGALTSVPALTNLFFSLWSALLPTFLAWALTAILTALVLFLVDMKLAALSPFLFMSIGRQIDRTIPKETREKVAIGFVAAICVTLASLSMYFSWNGNAAVVDMLYSDKGSTYHIEITKADSAKNAVLHSINTKWSSQIEAAKKADAEKKTTLAKEGRQMVVNAMAACSAKYGADVSTKYRTKYNEYVSKAKGDSTQHVGTFQPSAAWFEMKANEQLSGSQTAHAASAEELRKKKEGEEKSRNLQAKAVFMLTGGLGSAATLLGLFLLGLQTLLTWKSSAANATTPPLTKDDFKNIKDDVYTYLTQYKGKLSAGVDTAKTEGKILELLEDMEAANPDEADKFKSGLAVKYGYQFLK